MGSPAPGSTIGSMDDGRITDHFTWDEAICHDGTPVPELLRPNARKLASQLEIWRVTGDQPARELSLQPFDCNASTGWGPSNVQWRTRDTIALVRNRLPADSLRRANGERDTSPALLVRSAGTWVLDTSAVVARPRPAP